MTDPVDNPSHYNKGGIEVIDVIETYAKSDFRLANVIKYVCRCDYKGQKLQDLQKAAWYLDRAIVDLEAEADIAIWEADPANHDFVCDEGCPDCLPDIEATCRDCETAPGLCIEHRSLGWTALDPDPYDTWHHSVVDEPDPREGSFVGVPGPRQAVVNEGDKIRGVSYDFIAIDDPLYGPAPSPLGEEIRYKVADMGPSRIAGDTPEAVAIKNDYYDFDPTVVSTYCVQCDKAIHNGQPHIKLHEFIAPELVDYIELPFCGYLCSSAYEAGK